MKEEEAKVLVESLTEITKFLAALLATLIIKGVVTVEEFNEISDNCEPVILTKIKAALDVSRQTE